MFENMIKFFKNIVKKEDRKQSQESSKDAAKERLHLVLMQDRANVSADFLELMKQEIIDVIKKYIEIDEKEIDVRLTNKENEDGTNGAPALYANIPILNIKNDARKINKDDIEEKKVEKEQDKQEDKKNAIKDNKEEKEETKQPENDDNKTESKQEKKEHEEIANDDKVVKFQDKNDETIEIKEAEEVKSEN